MRLKLQQESLRSGDNMVRYVHVLRWYTLTLLFITALVLPHPAAAIPPPDFLFQIGSQVGQLFSLLAVGIGAGVAAVGSMFRPFLLRFRQRKLLVAAAAIVVAGSALTITLIVERLRSDAFQEQFNAEVAASLENAIASRDSLPSTRPPVDTTLPLVITNTEFDAADESSIYVLDAREDEEYAIGRYPGSHHIRFADVLDGAWASLPTDEVVYVMCWSGIRGSEVAEFLRMKGVPARYLEDGADGWVKNGGLWNGEIAFSSTYADARYTGTLATEDVRAAVAHGAALVDARQADAYAASHIDGSVNISVIFTPSDELDALLDLVPDGADVVTVCDDFVSCFDAKIVGIKLEYRSHVFLGRYAKPWEYSL